MLGVYLSGSVRSGKLLNYYVNKMHSWIQQMKMNSRTFLSWHNQPNWIQLNFYWLADASIRPPHGIENCTLSDTFAVLPGLGICSHFQHMLRIFCLQFSFCYQYAFKYPRLSLEYKSTNSNQYSGFWYGCRLDTFSWNKLNKNIASCCFIGHVWI